VLLASIGAAALFPLDATAQFVCTIPLLSGNLTSSVSTIQSLSGGGALIGTGNGLFRYDPASSPPLTQVPGSLTGSISTIESLPSRGALIGTANGLFRYDPASSPPLTQVPDVLTGSVLSIESLSGGGTLIGTGDGLFRYDPASSPPLTQVPEPDVLTGSVFTIESLPSGGALIGTANGLFRYDPASSPPLTRVPGSLTGSVFTIESLPSGGALIGTDDDLFRYDPGSSPPLTQVPGYPTGARLTTIQSLSSRGALISTGFNLFRYNPASSPPLTQVPGLDVLTGSTPITIQSLSGGGALIGTGNGLFRYDPASSPPLTQVPGSLTGSISTIESLPSRGALIGTANGLFRYDPGLSPPLTRVPGSLTGSASTIESLPSGGALIGVGIEVFLVTSNPLTTASVTGETTLLRRLQPGPNPIEVTVTFHHACAPVATELGLSLVALRDDEEVSAVPVRYPYGGSPDRGATSATLAASFVFDRPGNWAISLRQGATTIGQLPAFPIAGPPPPTIWQRLATVWERIVLGLGVLYAVGFAVLLGLAHRSTTAQRILADAVWAKWLTWPFFFLRHVPAVQRWVLEPWFQEVRRTTQRGVAFLEPPVTDGLGQQIGGPALLDRLRSTKRLWLQGRSGMGKSSVFAAWERAYFTAENAPDLARAARLYGFILIMLPVRHYAALPLEPNRPRSWVLEAVRLRLEQFGFVTRELGLIEAMLNTGHIAIALDGMNEADRDASLTDFARQFSMVPLLVTSQTAAPNGWEAWRLPESINALRNGLLELWLGPDKAQILSRRIQAESLADEFVSGYDLRLVVDLASADPEHAPLPANRIALYRTMLARARDSAGQPLRLEELKQVAWKMVTERRRDIRTDDQKLLPPGGMDALSKEGVRIVRQVGNSFEFRHDLMRAFLAASWLVEETPNIVALQQATDKAGAFDLNRRDQEELWSFVAALLNDSDLIDLWLFAGDELQRSILLHALQAEADKRDVELRRPKRRR
jgi:ligand-binding sensor domain-containing protein